MEVLKEGRKGAGGRVSGGEALACSAVSASHSASGAFVRNFAEGRVWFGAASPRGRFALTEWVGGGGEEVRRQRKEDEGVSWPAGTAEGCHGPGPSGADLRKATRGSRPLLQPSVYLLSLPPFWSCLRLLT